MTNAIFGPKIAYLFILNKMFLLQTIIIPFHGAKFKKILPEDPDPEL